MRHAKRIVSIYERMCDGQTVTYDEICEYGRARIFWHRSGKDVCTCRAFPDEHRCLHTIGLALRSGRVTVPAESDPTPLSVSATGRRPRVGDRYSIDTTQQTVQQVLQQFASQVPVPHGRSDREGLTATKRPAAAGADAGPHPPAKSACKRPASVWRLRGLYIW